MRCLHFYSDFPFRSLRKSGGLQQEPKLLRDGIETAWICICDLFVMNLQWIGMCRDTIGSDGWNWAHFMENRMRIGFSSWLPGPEGCQGHGDDWSWCIGPTHYQSTFTLPAVPRENSCVESQPWNSSETCGGLEILASARRPCGGGGGDRLRIVCKSRGLDLVCNSCNWAACTGIVANTRYSFGSGGILHTLDARMRQCGCQEG